MPTGSPQYSYQSECGDQRWHFGHCVEVHCCRQEGQTPPVSKVFQTWPQVQDQKSCSPGDQPQNGQRIRGPEGFVLLSSRGAIPVPGFGMTAFGDAKGRPFPHHTTAARLALRFPE